MNIEISEYRIRNNRIRREQELHRHLFICLITMILATEFSLLFFGFRAKAQESNYDVSCKQYKSIVIESGDTLWDYACQYGDKQYYKNRNDYIKEIIHINSLDDETIIAGKHLILPYYISY